MAQPYSEQYCPYCGKIKSVSTFITDYTRKGYYLPCCKSCTDELYRTHVEQYGEIGAIWIDCMVNNVPFIQQVWEEFVKAIADKEVKSPFATYYKTLKDLYGLYEGVWNSDCWYGSFITTKNPDEIKTLSTEDVLQLIKTWGKFTTEDGEVDYDAYDFLENRYEKYTETVVGLTDAMAMQFRNLCKAEWQKIKADESGDISEIDRAQKLVDRLLSALKLDDFAVEKSDVDRFIDKLIWRIEETEPAELEDENTYNDIAGNEKLFDSLMRSMRNLITGSRDYPEIPTEEM